jgi:hypothetical protein
VFFVEATSLKFKYNLGEDNLYVLNVGSHLSSHIRIVLPLFIVYLVTSYNTTSLASLYYTSPSDILRNQLTMFKLMSLLLQLVLVILFTPSLCCPEDQKQALLHIKSLFPQCYCLFCIKKPAVQVRIMEFQHRLLPIGSCRINFLFKRKYLV